MIKFILILMLVNMNSGEIVAVQNPAKYPSGFVSREDCETAAGLYSTDLPGFFMQFSCIESAIRT